MTAAAAILAASATQAKELTFFLGNEAIENNGQITYSLQEGDVENFGDYAEYNIRPQLYLHADLVGQVEINVASNHEVEVCIGTCIKSSEINRTLTMKSDQKLDLQYHIMGEVDNVKDIPTYVSTFTAFYTNDKEKTLKTFTIVVNPDTGAVELTPLKGDFHAVDGAIAYEVESPSTLTLYSLTGQKALTATIKGSGSIPTGHLTKGVYICTLNGHSEKVVLK